MDDLTRQLHDLDFSFPSGALIEWPFDFDAVARPLNERLVLTEDLALSLADLLAAEYIERLKEDQ